MTTTNETGRQRLERLRTEVAEMDYHAERARAQAASVPLPVRPGDEIHVLVTGVSIPTGGGFLATAHTSRAGETICLTEAMISASYNAGGQSWLAILGDDDAQISKWGEVRFRPGRAPEGIQTWNRRGDSDWVEQREAARREAWSQPTAQGRADALAAVNAKFGPAPTTSTTLSSAPDPSIAAAEAQRARLDASGKRFFMDYSAQEPGVKR